MTSKILIITDTTKQASVSILDALQIVQTNQSSVKIIFTSYLSDLFKKNLGPNTLNHWMKEQKESLERVRSYFLRMDIPYDDKVITVPPWEMVLYEMEDGVNDLVIVQGDFFKTWRKDRTNCVLCSNIFSKSKCPILVINSYGETSDVDFGL